MYGNKIHVIEEDAFVGLKDLITLALSDCGLNEMYPLGPVKGNLKNLRLSSNCLIVIPTDYFCGFIRLRTISLENNKFLAVPNVTPLVTQLYKIELGRNNIPSFEPCLTHTTFPRMLQLKVNNNEIECLSRDMIRHCPELVRLNLRNNLLKTMEDLSGLIRGPSASLTVRYCSYHMLYVISIHILSTLIVLVISTRLDARLV